MTAAPAVTISAPTDTNINSAGSTTFTLTYDIAPTNLVAGDITINGGDMHTCSQSGIRKIVFKVCW